MLLSSAVLGRNPGEGLFMQAVIAWFALMPFGGGIQPWNGELAPVE